MGQIEIRELTLVAVAVRIAVALVLGGVIGLERGMKNRPAGLRTYMLVCLGACLIMVTNQYIYQVFAVGDPVRMGAQVVSGIGFLGAGTIIVTKRNQIKGLTTAAGLWAAAAVGLATGIGFYEAAISGAIMIFLVLTVLSSLDGKIHRKAKVMELYVELDQKVTLGSFVQQIRAQNIRVDNVQMDFENNPGNGNRSLLVDVSTSKRTYTSTVVDAIGSIEGVIYTELL